MDLHERVARELVPLIMKGQQGTTALSLICGEPKHVVDASLAPLANAGQLLRTNALRAGVVQFDYRASIAFKPTDDDFVQCRGGAAFPEPSITPVVPTAPRPRAAAPAAAPPRSQPPAVRAPLPKPESLGWAVAGNTRAETERPATKENSSMVTTRKPRPTKAASAQFQICALLMADGDLTREELAAKVAGVDAKAFTNGITNAKSNGRIVLLKGSGKFHITASGREWTSGGSNLKNQQASTDSPAVVVTGKRAHKSKDLDQGERTRLGVVEVRNGKPVVDSVEARPTSFRCAVFSDGGFFLAKGDQKIELDEAEHRWMLRYLERMDEQEA